MYNYILSILVFIFLCSACSEKKEAVVTPWGTTIGTDSVEVSQNFTYNDMISNGEMIVLTLSGPDSYYDYHGKGMGWQYMLSEKFAQKIGVSVRVVVCKDTLDMVNKLKKGEGDVIAMALPHTFKGIQFTRVGPVPKAISPSDTVKNKPSATATWAVQHGNTDLANALNAWFTPSMVAEVQGEERFMLSTRSVTRHVYSPMLDRSAGVISRYDHHFKKYAPVAGWDWRLLAAQCYQESTFDPQARSWAGACGLMQIMPATAAHLGLPAAQLFHPEMNIAAAAKYIRELEGMFRDVPGRMERVNFVLAGYNGGPHHIRDAMALAKKYGKDPGRWSEVEPFVLQLSQAQYYNDPVVRYGYMRGSETVNYVQRIRARWAQYRGFASGGFSGSMGGEIPHRAKRKHRFKL